jgi:hypothetical protein
MIFKVFNPTQWDIELRMGSKFFTIKPYSSLIHSNVNEEPFDVIYDPNLFDFLMSQGKEMGLVDISFDKREKAKHPGLTFEKYKIKKSLEGLKEVYRVQKFIEEMQMKSLQERRVAGLVVHKDEDDLVLKKARHKMTLLQALIKDLGDVVIDRDEDAEFLKQTYVKPKFLTDLEKAKDNK